MNLTGALTGSMLATDRLSKEIGGSGGLVINIASMAGLVAGTAARDNRMVAYEVSKHGVVAMTKSLGDARVGRRTGIKVIH